MAVIPTSKKLPTDRPAELAAFFAIAGPVYAWLVSSTVNAPNVLAIVLAFIAGVVPLAVSTVKDGRRPADDPGDRVVESIPPVPPGFEEHERAGVDHADERRGAG